MVTSGFTSASGTSVEARVLSGKMPQRSSSSATAAVNALLVLAMANGIAGVTVRLLLVSPTPTAAVRLRPSSQRMATDTPEWRDRRAFCHATTFAVSAAERVGSIARAVGSGTGRAAQVRQSTGPVAATGATDWPERPERPMVTLSSATQRRAVRREVAADGIREV